MSLVEELSSRDRFCLHTGNINDFGELKLRGYKNSADELLACVELQLRKSTCEQYRDTRAILLPNDNSGHNLGNYDRDDLKITLKVFLNRVDYEQVVECLRATFEQLAIDSIEQLIVAFPEIELNIASSASEDEEAAAWLESIKSVWHGLEKMVADRQVLSLGVADLQLAQLRALYEWAPTVKPCIDHFNIAGCCSVPPELQAYAQQHDIQLLTHNDPKVFLTNDSFPRICENIGGEHAVCCTSFAPSWAARYTVWVRRRSIIAAKGYLVQFERRRDNLVVDSSQ